jgi:hypothetical protein
MSTSAIDTTRVGFRTVHGTRVRSAENSEAHEQSMGEFIALLIDECDLGRPHIVGPRELLVPARAAHIARDVLLPSDRQGEDRA